MIEYLLNSIAEQKRYVATAELKIAAMEKIIERLRLDPEFTALLEVASFGQVVAQQVQQAQERVQ